MSPVSEYLTMFGVFYQESLQQNTIIQLECPANATITDSVGRTIGYEANGTFINNIPNATAIFFSNGTRYVLPRNLAYTIQINGRDIGVYNLSITYLNVSSMRTFGFFNSSVTDSTNDTFDTSSDGDLISFKTLDTNKTYSLVIAKIIGNTNNSFVLTNMSLGKMTTHMYAVLNWDALNDTTAKSVKLTIDENSDGTPDHTVDLHTGMTGEDVESIIEGGGLPEGEEEGGLIGKISDIPWLYIIIPVVIIVVLAGVGLGIKRRKRKVAPP